ncbi:MAG: formate dehydrogenase subunit gamma [Betaproteobacteria bacterium]|nr:formate dehydrogenase subunit gamma [Betaproteobacteria bacterium]
MNKALVAPELSLVSQLLVKHQATEGGLLPLLHDIQDHLGFIPPNAVPLIAEGMNLSRAEVHGVITYYHFFRSTCCAEACQACGSEDLLALAEQTLGCKVHETSADGLFSLEPVYCLGLCASSPAVQVDDKMHARMSADKLKQLVTALRSAS